jgi:hypothetical protein
MKYWLSQGVAARKLLVGIPFYGQSFTLDNAAITRDQAAVGVRARGAGYPGQFTKQSGMLAYYEICSLGAYLSLPIVFFKDKFKDQVLNRDMQISNKFCKITNARQNYLMR